MWTLDEQRNGFFNNTQKMQLSRIFNSIFPGKLEMNIPNAEKAGAVDFLNLLLARDESVYYEIMKWREDYPIWLTALNSQSEKLFKKKLQHLSTDEATIIVEKLEKGHLEDFDTKIPLNQTLIFDTLRRHCIQGCFSDARWGGNTNNIMWKAYGYQEEIK